MVGKKIDGRQKPKESMTYSGKCKKFSINQSTHAIYKERNEAEDKEEPDHKPRQEIWILA